MIIYFSSTGNSLSTAKLLAREINEEALHINKAILNKNTNDKIIGLVYPTHYMDMPNIMKKFINDFNFGDPEYIFGIATHGGDPGIALFTLKDLLKKKNLKLSYGKEIKMPVNSRLMYRGVATKIDELVSNQKEESKNFVKDIQKRVDNSENIKEKKFAKFVSKLSNTNFVKNYYSLSVDEDKCIKCGTCVKVCPVKNIKQDENGIKFDNHCETCFTCIHWCPTQAIKIRNKNIEEKHQYHHPDVNIEEIKDV